MAMPRGLRYPLIGAAVLVVLLVAVFLVLTRTDFGVEQAGRLALERIGRSVNGELRVGAIRSRGILRGVSVHDVAIDGPDGRPFLRADSARLSYHLRTLLGGAISFDRLILHDPEIYIEKLPGQEEWNYERIFPGDTVTATDTVPDEDLVLIDDATIFGGLVVVRLPWEPDEPVQPDDTARLILEDVPGGIARVLRFEDVAARLPRIVWEAPDEEGKLIRIGELSARAYIWETPADVRRLEGTVTIRDSLLTFEAPVVRLPESQLSMLGRIVVGEGENHYDIEAQGADLAFRDFQWLYPRLPAQGGGALQFRIQTQEPGNLLWLAREARLRTGGTEVAGAFGVVTGDTLYFTNVDLQASPLDLNLLQSLLPVELPVDGLLIGTVEVDGPISALRTRGDMVYRENAGGVASESALRWAGTVSAERPYGVAGLEADVRRLDLGQVARLVPALRLRGVATGQVRADGSLARGLRVGGNVDLVRNGARSSVRGAGEFSIGGNRSAFDLEFEAMPLGLDILAEQVPALRQLAGEATGPVTVTGSLDDLRVDADLLTPAGALVLNGRLALTGPEPVYRGRGSVADFRLDRLLDGLPETVITASFDVDGRGRTAESLDGWLSLDVTAATVEGVDVQRGTARVRVRDGLARVDTLFVATALGDARADGTFGVGAGREGELQLAVRLDSLAPLEPLLLRRGFDRDSLMQSRTGLAGLVRLDGTLRGSLDRWVAHGTAHARDARYGPSSLARAEAEFDLSGGPDTGLVLEGTLDSLRFGHRLLAHASVAGRYVQGRGDVVMEARGLGAQQLQLAGAFAREPDDTWFRVGRLNLTTRDGRWALADTAAGRLGRSGLSLEPVELAREGGGARIRFGGVLPWREGGEADSLPAAFTAEVTGVRIGELLRVTQTDTLIDGVVTGRFDVRGTALAPVMEGRVSARAFRYGEALLDSVGGSFAYRDRVLTGGVAGWRGTEEIVRGDGTIPLELAMTDRETRRLDRPMRVEVRADSVPAALVAFLAPGFREVAGTLNGQVVVGGTPLDPALRGELRLTNGTGVFEPAGVRYRQIAATARMGEGSVLRVDGRFRSGDGTGLLSGTLDVARPSDPLFDLTLEARNLDAARRRDVIAVADGRLHLGGRYTRPVVSGDIRIVEGELNIGEIWRQYQIVELNPSLFELFDTATVNYRPDAASPFLANIQVRNATVRAERDFWLRSDELNVEVTGDLELDFDRRAEDVRMTGVLQATRGSYELQVARGTPGRRFEIRQGTIEFVGTPGIDPNLAIDAGYRVRRAQGDPIDVVAVVSGTLQSPRVRLTSESDLPLSEADLASYLLFGRSSLELSQSESDLVSQGVQGAWGLARPMLSGLASSQLQNLAASLGLGIDYLALSTPEFGLGEYGELDGWIFQDAQLEVGWYARRDLFVMWSMPIRPADLQRSFAAGGANRLRLWGTRIEWRFKPTWKGEFFLEDRFARTPSFGLGEITTSGPRWGLSLLREWGY